MTKNTVRLALLTSTVAMGFDWKMDGDKLATDGDGNPVWINGDKELTVKGDTISSLQGEAKTQRQFREKAEAALAKFNGIDDPDAARTALETVRDIDTSKLINAGKLDEVRQQMTQQFEGRIKEANDAREAALQRADNVLLDSAFNGSEFARERLAVPVEMVRATFGKQFKIEDGKIVATNSNGDPIYSDKDMGHLASFDEALEKIVGGYKYKDSILKAPDAGSGTGGSGGGGQRGQGRSMTMSQFENLNPIQKAEFAGKVASGEASLSD